MTTDDLAPRVAAVLAEHLDGPCDDPRCHLLGRRNVGPLSEHLAESIAAVLREGEAGVRAAALREAADEGDMPTEVRIWLHRRANRTLREAARPSEPPEANDSFAWLGSDR